MSDYHPQQIECGCGHRFGAKVADSLHVSAHPELRQAILDGSLHRFTCPSCQRAVQLETLLSYTDFERLHWFTVVPPAALRRSVSWIRLTHDSFRATMEERAAPMVQQQWAPRMRKRVIFGLASLREKLLAFAAELDDRALEWIKLTIARGRGVTVDEHTYFHFVRKTAGYIYFEVPHEDRPGTWEMPVPEALYMQALSAIRSGVERNALMDEIAVDFRAAYIAGDSAASGALEREDM